MSETNEKAAQDPEVVLGELWQRNYDPTTRQIIEELPIRPHWRCLDVGAGLGSMSYWMAERVPQGSVLAVDTETRHLSGRGFSNLTVRQLDVTEADFEEESFDLILLRSVLAHLGDPEKVLEKAVEWLSPGGWVVAEDFYFLPSEDGPSALNRKVVDAYTGAAAQSGMDMRLGRRLPAMLARTGLDDVETRLRPLGPGQGDRENELMRRRMELQGHPLVENGLLTAEEIAEFNAGLDDPRSRDVTTLLFSVQGRRTT
ncbi:class I SAM-dependent methyltransferase [Actinopolyspora mortivallis]|uniref:Ubiquinone biosynthesis methyltransferase UbiE n=1 Tax=Actinopolyspora mortivallis TaxID=33906 RepID=A0A2T0GYM8_ACTMO|nr:methyltransferase domain-containing protein [Actinopolyspora mortivallis]PRW64222.1 ubiquinone biosynthesis methyltransferase UbiE [Actinopolyspora mortivallis]